MLKSLGLLMGACAIVRGAPLQYVYEDKLSKKTALPGGCVMRSWEGSDVDGMAGFPWISTINCTAGAKFLDSGVVLHGPIRVFLRHGSLSTTSMLPAGPRQERVSLMGSSFWASEGVHIELEVDGFVYVVGAPYELGTAPACVFTSDYAAPLTRTYFTEDAVAGRSHAVNVHDMHIDNGTTNARDLAWSSIASVDPPSITVMNCAPESSYVWFHSHPYGAVYLPYAGEICFQTSVNTCVSPGTARWTSPNLYYYETFNKLNEADAEAEKLVGLAFSPANASLCHQPVVFGVTNFDPDQAVGQPNFVDIPANAIAGKKWGAFPHMVVRSTTVITKSVHVDLD